MLQRLTFLWLRQRNSPLRFPATFLPLRSTANTEVLLTGTAKRSSNEAHEQKIREEAYAGRLDAAVKLLSDMKKEGLVASSSISTLLLTRLSQQSDVHLLKEAYGNIQSQGISLNESAYKTMLKFFEDRFMTEEAIEIKNEMEDNGVPLTADIYNNLIVCCVSAKRLEKALELLEEMEKKWMKPRTFVYSCIIDEYLRRGDLRNGLKFYDEARERQVVPGFLTYRLLIKQCFQNQRIKKAQSIYDDMRNNGKTPDLDIISIMLNLLKHSPDKVDSLLQDIESFQYKIKFDVVLYTTIIDAYIKTNRLHKVDGIMKTMEANHISPNRITYNIVMRAFAHEGNCDKCLSLYKDMQAKNLEADSFVYKNIICSYSRRIMAIKKEVQLGYTPDEAAAIHEISQLENQIKEWAVKYLYSGSSWYDRILVDLERALHRDDYREFAAKHAKAISHLQSPATHR